MAKPMITLSFGGGEDSFEIKDQKARSNIDKKIDKPTVAKVGQVIAIKTVDENGVPTEFEAIDAGSTGSDGKSAYEYAQDGGYTGTEEEFISKLVEESASKTSVDNLSAIIQNSEDVFDDTKTYSSGEYVIKDNRVYKFTSNKDVGDWDETLVEATDIMSIVSELNKKTIYTQEATVNINTGASIKEIVKLTIPKGAYIVIRKASFGINTDGRRGIGSGSTIFSTISPVDKVATEMSVADVYNFDGEREITLGVVQTSGIELSVTGYITAIKL